MMIILISTLEIPQPLFWVLTSLVAGVIGLLTYLWRAKDKAYEKMDGTLSGIDDKLDKTLNSITGINTRLIFLEKGREEDTNRIRGNELEISRLQEKIKHRLP